MSGQAPGQAIDAFHAWMDSRYPDGRLFEGYGGGDMCDAFEAGMQAQRDLAAQEQPAPELAKILTADGRWAAMQPVPELAAETLKELTRIRSGIAGLAADLDRSAAETRPSRKSETESETAIALRRLLETP